MNKKIQFCPKGYHTVNTVATYKDSARAIEFYKKAFGAQEISRFPSPRGGVMHAELKIGESMFMMGDEMPERNCLSAESLKGSPIAFFLYVDNVDARFDQAVAAGAKETMAVTDMFWGDRCGAVTDPFGYTWTIATHQEDLTQEEIRTRGEKFMAAMANA